MGLGVRECPGIDVGVDVGWCTIVLDVMAGPDYIFDGVEIGTLLKF